MRYIKCEGCGKVLKLVEDIRYSERGEQTYTIDYNGGELVWEREDFYPDSNGEGCFFCEECGEKISGIEQEVMEEYIDRIGEEEEKRCKR